MATLAIPQQNKDILAEILLSKFDLSPDLIKEITNKALKLAKTQKPKYELSKRFKEGGLAGIAFDAIKAVIKPQKQKTPSIDPSISPAQETSQSTIQQSETRPKRELDLIKEEEKPITVLIGGLTQDGVNNLKDKLPEIFDSIFKKLPKQQEEEKKKTKFSEGGLLGMLPKGLLAMGGGVALLLGGLAALVTGLQTEGPFKGLLKILSKVGLMGGLKLLEKGAKTFLKNLTSIVKAPVNLLKTITKSIGKIFGVGAFKTVTTAIKGAKGIFAKMLGGLVKVITPLLKRIPLIGTIISWGFAYTRFKSGDVVGGIIDVLSGIASIFPGVGTAISIGLDILNAFLDFKAGGADKKASAKKGNILWDWIKGLGSLIWKGIKYIPVIGPLFDMVESITKGEWFNALWHFARINPLFDPLIGIIEWFTGGSIKEQAQKGVSGMGNKLLDWGKGIAKWVYEGAKKLPIIGQLIKTGEFLYNKEWAKALVAFSRVIPGVGWIMDMLGLTEEKQLQATEKGLDPIKKLWKWIKDSLWEKVTGFIGSLVDGVKDWWNNLSWDPRSWIGMSPDSAVPTNPTTASNPNSQPVPMADGGIVTQPTNALVGEAGPEAVIPLEKITNITNNQVDNIALEKIVNNTSNTNDSIKILSQAILKLAQTFEKRPGSSSNNVFINGQQQQGPSASQVAASNIDPIRQIRAQFAI